MTNTNNRGLARIVAPAAEPVTLAEAKEFLRIEHHDDDNQISEMILAARSLAESWMKRSLVTQSWKVTLSDSLESGLRLPMGPVQSITSIITTSKDGVENTIATSAYALSSAKTALVLDNTLFAHQIEVSYVAGYGTSDEVPRPIKLGILRHVAVMVDGEAHLAPIPDAVLAYYTPYRELFL